MAQIPFLRTCNGTNTPWPHSHTKPSKTHCCIRSLRYHEKLCVVCSLHKTWPWESAAVTRFARNVRHVLSSTSPRLLLEEQLYSKGKVEHDVQRGAHSQARAIGTVRPYIVLGESAQYVRHEIHPTHLPSPPSPPSISPSTRSLGTVLPVLPHCTEDNGVVETSVSTFFSPIGNHPKRSGPQEPYCLPYHLVHSTVHFRKGRAVCPLSLWGPFRG